MQQTKDIFNKTKYNDKILKENYTKALNNKKVLQLRERIKLEDKKLYKHVPNLIDSSIEFDNCLNCKGLANGQNEIKGYCYYPEINDDQLIFSYVACKYKNN